MNDQDRAEFERYLLFIIRDGVEKRQTMEVMMQRTWMAACDHKIMTEADYYLPVIQNLKDQIKQADSLLILLAKRISNSPKTRSTHQDEWALDAFEDYKTKHL